MSVDLEYLARDIAQRELILGGYLQQIEVAQVRQTLVLQNDLNKNLGLRDVQNLCIISG